MPPCRIPTPMTCSRCLTTCRCDRPRSPGCPLAAGWPCRPPWPHRSACGARAARRVLDNVPWHAESAEDSKRLPGRHSSAGCWRAARPGWPTRCSRPPGGSRRWRARWRHRSPGTPGSTGAVTTRAGGCRPRLIEALERPHRARPGGRGQQDLPGFRGGSPTLLDHRIPRSLHVVRPSASWSRHQDSPQVGPSPSPVP